MNDLGTDVEDEDGMIGGLEFRNRCGKRMKFVGWFRGGLCSEPSLKCGFNKAVSSGTVDDRLVSIGDFNELFTKTNGPLLFTFASFLFSSSSLEGKNKIQMELILAFTLISLAILTSFVLLGLFSGDEWAIQSV